MNASEQIAEIKEENTYLREIIAGLTGENDQPIEGLTPLQSKVVWLLRNASGRLISKSHMIDALYWDRLDPPGEKIIAITVWRIRKRQPKIGHCIQAVYGEGYRWREHDA